MYVKAFIVFIFLTSFECSRILILHPSPSRSHIIPLQSLAVELAKKDHEITFISSFSLDKKLKNYREFTVPMNEADKDFLEEMTKNPKSGGLLSILLKGTSLAQRLSYETLQMSEMKRLMNEEQFDIVIVGWFFYTEALLGLADHFKCPSILFSPAGTLAAINKAVGNPLAVSGAAHLAFSSLEMNFVGRLKNFLITSLEVTLTRYLSYEAEKMYK